jgi:hypothetical protein
MKLKETNRKIIAEGSSEASFGVDDIMMRSYDGRVSTILLPDNTRVYVYKEKKATQEINSYTLNTVILIFRPDTSVIKIQQDGEIVIISAEERERLNKSGMEIGKDVDYFYNLFADAEERKSGVYTVNMEKGKIWTKDDELNRFELYSNGITKVLCIKIRL